MSRKPATVLEVVVFTVRNPEAFDAIQAATHSRLASSSGFVRSVRLRNAEEPALRADLVAWTSLDAATAAAKTVQQDPQSAPLMSSIDQIRVYGHYTVNADPVDFLGSLAASPVVEIAAYTVADAVAARAIYPKVYEALRGHAGYRLGAPGLQHDDPNQCIDIIGWTAPEACHAASTALQGVAELSGFFGSIKEMKLFEMFVPLA